jgi:hypothetical protein
MVDDQPPVWPQGFQNGSVKGGGVAASEGACVVATLAAAFIAALSGGRRPSGSRIWRFGCSETSVALLFA